MKMRVFVFYSKKSGEIWASLKNAEDGLGVQNISRLV